MARGELLFTGPPKHRHRRPAASGLPTSAFLDLPRGVRHGPGRRCRHARLSPCRAVLRVRDIAARGIEAEYPPGAVHPPASRRLWRRPRWRACASSGAAGGRTAGARACRRAPCSRGLGEAWPSVCSSPPLRGAGGARWLSGASSRAVGSARRRAVVVDDVAEVGSSCWRDSDADVARVAARAGAAALWPRVAQHTLRLAASARADGGLAAAACRSSSARYVNFERFACSSVGFDYVDDEFDIFVAPQRMWEYDDEDEFEEAERIGPARGGGRRAGGRAPRDRADRAVGPPFRDGWEAISPTPAWGARLALPPGWHVLDALSLPWATAR